MSTTTEVCLATFAAEHWELMNGVLMNAQHPATFEIPDEITRNSLEAGDIVKLAFEPSHAGGHSERMWVIVDSRSGPYYVGRLNNHPYQPEFGLAAGSQVVFLPEHVICTE